jgi:hypothetical protein
MKHLKSLLLLTVLSLCIWANSASAAQITYLDVIAKIDGSDWFELVDNQWRWKHGNYDPAELHEGLTPTEVIVNGNSQFFTSDWSNGTGYGAYSGYNVVAGLDPIQDVFGANPNVWLEVVSGRGSVSFDQLPNATNGYTSRIFINDDGYGGHDHYHFRIVGEAPTPEPATMTLGLLGLGGLLGLKRRK